ncbi:MAG: cellulase family glycosylhydrolase [Candidatus Hydrogenedentes bacterium]|nr:cellulase family glycosylhydrolase [Candidatus Hydrogenedentota bacterium]
MFSPLCVVIVSAMVGAPEYLSVDGKDIKNASGEVVSLRGVNFGSWLMMETWIPSFGISGEDHLKRLAAEAGIAKEWLEAVKKTGAFDDDVTTIAAYRELQKKNLAPLVSSEKAQAFWAKAAQEPPIMDAVTLDRVLRQRFGDGGAQEIWDAFHATWYTELDFKRAKEIGFNFVRIPFWYRWFEDDNRPYDYKAYGFQWLDKAVGWAKANELYVLLDLHGAPGCQSPWEHTGELSRGELFKNEECQLRTYALWKAIARHYRDEPAVCVYGCLNEPFSAKDAADWTRVHDGIYQAIRSEDSRHIIMMEDGYKTDDPPYKEQGFFPKPSEHGWKNVIYSIHFYQTGDMRAHEKRGAETVRIAEMEQGRCGVPMYIGEFNSITDSSEAINAMGYYCSLFNRKGLHWSPWTFKYTGASEKSLWGVYQYAGKWDMPDIHRDSKEALLKKIGRLAADNFAPHEGYAAELRRRLREPVVSASSAATTGHK